MTQPSDEAQPGPSALGVDFTLVGRDRDLNAALIGVPQVVLWGATHLGLREAKLWRYEPGVLRQRVAHQCPPNGRAFIAVRDLPAGVYLAQTAYADRRHLHEHLIRVTGQSAQLVGLEDAIRCWLTDI